MKALQLGLILLALSTGVVAIGCSSTDNGDGSSSGSKGDDDDDDDDDDDGDDDDDDGASSSGGRSSSSGGGGSSSSSGSPAGAGVGDQCETNGDCESNSCLKSGDVAFGYCTITCEDFSECPNFWECRKVGNASQTYCVK